MPAISYVLCYSRQSQKIFFLILYSITAVNFLVFILPQTVNIISQTFKTLENMILFYRQYISL